MRSLRHVKNMTERSHNMLESLMIRFGMLGRNGSSTTGCGVRVEGVTAAAPSSLLARGRGQDSQKRGRQGVNRDRAIGPRPAQLNPHIKFHLEQK